MVPPSDISRTKPLVRLILNQIARRLTETLPDGARSVAGRRLLLMLDEFPALGRLDFFETSLAFMAGYGVRAFLVAQSLHQIDKAYGPNHAILDNCHVRVAFAPNDERTAKRLSDALGTTTELRAPARTCRASASRRGCRTSRVSEQETPRPLLTAGEVLQLPADDALVLVSGMPPIRARKLKYYTDRNFLRRRLPAPALRADALCRCAAVAQPTTGRAARASTDARLEKVWSELVRQHGRGRPAAHAARHPAPQAQQGASDPLQRPAAVRRCSASRSRRRSRRRR